MALRRVFLSTPLETSTTSQLRLLLVPYRHHHPALPSRRFFTGIRRDSPLEDAANNPQRQPPPRINPHDPVLDPSIQAPNRDTRSARAHKPKNGSSSPSGRLPRDDEIAAMTEYVLLRREDGRVSEPRAVTNVLMEAQLRDQTLVAIALPRGVVGGGPKYPVCVLLDRAGYEESERVRKREEAEKGRDEKRRKAGTKELEINWAIADHDLQVKMRKMREFLGKGLRVEVLLFGKTGKRNRGKKVASKEEMEELLVKVRAAADDVPGSKEVKRAEGTVGLRYQMFFEGPQGGVVRAKGEDGS
jgi:translation initiation factor IF-3